MEKIDQMLSEDLGHILDIPLQLSMELGKTNMSIRELLKLTPGSIVELSKAVSEPIDIYVNGTLLAQGEMMAVNDKFAIRLTEVMNSAEKIGTLT
jgi:flagellar motor switch protein FliN/FliY